MERSAMFGRHSALCQPSCSSRQHRTPADRVTTCVATPVKPPTAKVAKRYGCCSVIAGRLCKGQQLDLHGMGRFRQGVACTASNVSVDCFMLYVLCAIFVSGDFDFSRVSTAAVCWQLGCLPLLC